MRHDVKISRIEEKLHHIRLAMISRLILMQNELQALGKKSSLASSKHQQKVMQDKTIVDDDSEYQE